jgi:hypothetical protein
LKCEIQIVGSCSSFGPPKFAQLYIKCRYIRISGLGVLRLGVIYSQVPGRMAVGDGAVMTGERSLAMVVVAVLLHD